MQLKQRRNQVIYSTVLPVIVYVFSLIWFLLLHKSLLMMLTLILNPSFTRLTACYRAHWQE